MKVTKDIVIDANVMRLFDKPKDPHIKALFYWLRKSGTLKCNRLLISEYNRSSNQLIMTLINELVRDGRYKLIDNSSIKSFKLDNHFKYTCNKLDVSNARLVFLSNRKRLISFDKNLRNDINNFPKVGGIKPCSCGAPGNCCLN